MDCASVVLTVLCTVAVCTGIALILWRFYAPLRRAIAISLTDAQKEAQWSQLPERILLLRHGQAEHNLEHGSILTAENPNRKPDNLSELTRQGVEESHRAGNYIRQLVGFGSSVSIIVSPFERALQTCLCVQQQLEGVEVRQVHVEPRVREQEFGNFQIKEDMRVHASAACEVGRFYYRRPTGESGADVYDRCVSFWHDLLNGRVFQFQNKMFSATQGGRDDALVIVTHGLTMRILLMSYFQWSPQTFDAVWNPGNADLWVLKKHPSERRYTLSPSECSPPRMPWATRQIRIHRKTESDKTARDQESSSGSTGGGTQCRFYYSVYLLYWLKSTNTDAAGETSTCGGVQVEVEDYTVVDYLSLPQPRTCYPEAALRFLIPGHGHDLNPHKEGRNGVAFVEDTLARCISLDAREVCEIDWWCGRMSEEGKQMRNVECGQLSDRRRLGGKKSLSAQLIKTQ